ncbi:MAG: rhomboid family protein [Verrucomicrobiae bacterium]|nr:rhomboid family protein [Verrucomicrobiae bacterium]MCB1087147.1 rhomboid family protein [Verrucomicrobiae bacterium]MCB1092910.1 rhomboid family protein [Verrucomicrobiae bacterium]
MTTPLSRTVCLIHPERPAAARCPSCGTFYCSECITEHDGRLTCARCLAAERELSSPSRRRERRLVLVPVLQFMIGFVVLWLMWQGIAQILLSIPADFHDGTIWE